MAIQLKEENDGKVLEVEVTGKLHREDYKHFVPEFERLVGLHAKLRVLFVMRDFHGWEPCALWEDIRFDMKHFADIERIAMVGDKTWEKGMAAFCIPFTRAKIRYFDTTHLAQARTWISESMPSVKPASTPASVRDIG